MFGLGTSELLVIFALVLVLFGPKKLPELGRALGRGIKSFKDGMNELEGEAKDKKDDTKQLADQGDEVSHAHEHHKEEANPHK